MKYLFLACILFSLNALAEVPIHLLGSFEAVQSSDGEHCNGYSIDLWQKSGTEIFGLLHHHAGLCGDPACSVVTGSNKNGYLTFSTNQPIYDNKYLFKGLINNSKQLVGQLNDVNLSLKGEVVTVKTETLNQWCSLWKQVPRCKGVQEYCVNSVNKSNKIISDLTDITPMKQKVEIVKATISSDCKFKVETGENSHLIEKALGSESVKCVTFPYLSKYTNPEPVMPSFHAGVDLQANNQAVYSLTNGTVMSACKTEIGKSACTDSMGIIMVETGLKGVKSRILYVHMSESLVKVGQQVVAGQKIGVSGNRFGGNAYGAGTPHLHIEVRPNYTGLSAVGRVSCGNLGCVTLGQVASLTLNPINTIDTDTSENIKSANKKTITNTDLPSNFKINQGDGSKSNSLSPPKTYQHWDACPFECCVYREWVAKEPVKIYQGRDEDSLVIATLNKEESVNALTGVVVTQKVGHAKVLMPISAWEDSKVASPSEVTIKKGEIIYPLHYEGEGYSAFWYKGKVYSGELIDAKKVNIEQPYQYEWWVQIKNKNGKMGWTKQTNVFAQQDACG